MRFHIVLILIAFANCFLPSCKEKEDKAIAELKSEGFESAKMLPLNKHNLFPVVYASYKKLEEAQLERKNIQNLYGCLW